MNKVLYFVLGAACGGAGVYFFMKDKFAKQTQEEINSVKEAYKNKDKVCENPEKKEEEKKEEKPPIQNLKPDIMEYAKQVNAYRQEEKKKVEKELAKKEDGPYIISEDTFNNSDYEAESLMYYADGILTYDINDEVIEDIDDTIGEKNLKHFEKSNDDAMYIRNEDRKVDYEVLKSLQSYSEIQPPKPRRVEQEE